MTCPECHLPMVRSTYRGDMLICPNDFRDCTLAGRGVDALGRAA